MTNPNDLINQEKKIFHSISQDKDDYTIHINQGLTKREYFAALVLQGLMSRANQNGIITNKIMVPDVAAKEAVTFADALIEKLNEEKK